MTLMMQHIAGIVGRRGASGATTMFSLIGSANIAVAYKLYPDATDSKGSKDGTNNGGSFVTESPSVLPGSWSGITNDYIDCGVSLGLVTNVISVSAWVKRPQSSGTMDVVGEDSGTQSNWSLVPYNGGLSFQIFVGGVAKTGGFGAELPDDVWAHVLGIYDGSEIKIYVNGVLGSTVTSVTGNIDTDTVGLNIGRRDDGSRFMNGEISQIVVATTDLTSIKDDIYNSGNGIPMGD